MRPRHLPASFLQPIHRSIDPSQLADRPQLCHPSDSFFCIATADQPQLRNPSSSFFVTNRLLNRSIATGRSTVALPPFCSFFTMAFIFPATKQLQQRYQKSISSYLFIIFKRADSRNQQQQKFSDVSVEVIHSVLASTCTERVGKTGMNQMITNTRVLMNIWYSCMVWLITML